MVPLRKKYIRLFHNGSFKTIKVWYSKAQKMKGSRFRLWALGLQIDVEGLGFQSLGFRIVGVGLRAWGFRVCGGGFRA